jgi:hypothetical protein
VHGQVVAKVAKAWGAQVRIFVTGPLQAVLYGTYWGMREARDEMSLEGGRVCALLFFIPESYTCIDQLSGGSQQ